MSFLNDTGKFINLIICKIKLKKNLNEETKHKYFQIIVFKYYIGINNL